MKDEKSAGKASSHIKALAAVCSYYHWNSFDSLIYLYETHKGNIRKAEDYAMI